MRERTRATGHGKHPFFRRRRDDDDDEVAASAMVGHGYIFYDARTRGRVVLLNFVKLL